MYLRGQVINKMQLFEPHVHYQSRYILTKSGGSYYILPSFIMPSHYARLPIGYNTKPLCAELNGTIVICDSPVASQYHYYSFTIDNEICFALMDSPTPGDLILRFPFPKRICNIEYIETLYISSNKRLFLSSFPDGILFFKKSFTCEYILLHHFNCHLIVKIENLPVASLQITSERLDRKIVSPLSSAFMTYMSSDKVQLVGVDYKWFSPGNYYVIECRKQNITIGYYLQKESEFDFHLLENGLKNISLYADNFSIMGTIVAIPEEYNTFTS